MAEGLNRVWLLGNLGADPDLRMTNGGQALLTLRIATNESYMDQKNERKQRTEWHRVTIWGRRGESLAKILKKGDSLFIEGRLSTRTFEKNGEKRYSTDIIASNVLLPGANRAPMTERQAELSRSHRPVSKPRPGDRAVSAPRGNVDDYDDYGDLQQPEAKDEPPPPKDATPNPDDDIPF